MKKILLSAMGFFFSQFLFAQVLLNEVSGDATNNDGTNDGLIELIGPANFDISCYVISNGEWLVVLPPGTKIPADGVFSIACGNAISPNPSPGTGLTCATCDFPNLPLDFDVCSPANANYVDWNASGFTIDNSSATDGDQIVLFAPNGTVLDAVQWSGGATSIYDNATVSANVAYTLGTGTGINTAQFPIALQTGGTCYNAAYTYSMPGINALNGSGFPIYTNLSPVQQSCNSSYVRKIGASGNATSDWSVTANPTPGFPNNAPVEDFTITGGATTQCGPAAATAVTVTYRVFNWQNVETTTTNTLGGRNIAGSYVTSDNSATLTPWTSIVRNNTTGITTLTYAFTPAPGCFTYQFIWKDASISPVNPNCCGVPTPTAGNVPGNECYSVRSQQFCYQQPPTGSLTTVCNSELGNLTVSGATGLNLQYSLLNNGVVVKGPQSSNVFLNIVDAPIGTGYSVKVSNGCTPDLSLAINPCYYTPPCPTINQTFGAAGGDNSICPNEQLTFSTATSTSLPAGGKIKYYYAQAPLDCNFNPRANQGVLLGEVSINGGSFSQVTESQNFNSLISACSATNNTWTNNSTITNWYSNRTTYQTQAGTNNTGSLFSYGACSGAAQSDRALGSRASGTTGSIIYGVRILNNTTDVMTSATISYDGEQWRDDGLAPTPAGTLAVDYQVDITGAAVTGVTIGTWTNVPALKYTTNIDNAGSSGIDGNANAQRLSFTLTGIAIPANGAFWVRWVDVDNAGDDHGMGIDNVDIKIKSTPVGVAAPDFNTTTLGLSFANAGDIFIKGIIEPFSGTGGSGLCPDSRGSTTCVTVNMTSPVFSLSGGGAICSGSNTALFISSNPASANYVVELYKDGLAFAGNTVTTNASGIATFNASAAGVYTINSITPSSGNCTGIKVAGQQAEITINTSPTASLSGSPINVCQSSVAEIPLTLTGTAPFNITYNIDGGASESTTASNGKIYVPISASLAAGAHTVNITNVNDESGCAGSASGSVTVNVSARPNAPTASWQCLGNTVNVSSIYPNATYTLVYVTPASSGTVGTTITATGGATTVPFFLPFATSFAFTVTQPSGLCPSLVASYAPAPSCVLPLDLLSFKLTNKTQTVLLDWQTANEQNVVHFVIEHSIDAIHFDAIGNIAAKGSRTSINDYDFTDIHPAYAKNYYRLRIVDADGKIKYSKVLSVDLRKANSSISLYPNPVKELLNISFEASKNGKASLIVLDAQGKQVLMETSNVQKGANVLRLNANMLASGTYFLRIQNDELLEVVKFVK